MLNIFNKIKSVFSHEPTIINNYIESPSGYVSDIFQSLFNGDKFPGSFGSTKDYSFVDYYTLRKRSMQLFKENLYAKGLIRTLLKNEINTGLNLEASPISEVITGMTDDQLQNWATDQEIGWGLYADDSRVCDWSQKNNLHEINKKLRLTALISGDCLVISRINKKTGLPAIELVDGSNIATPIDAKPRQGNKIVHGVEIDSRKRHVAFYIAQEDGTSKRVAAYGEKSGRKIAWLVYGTENRLDEVRGEPILSNVLYMLKELDRYKDSEQRAAVINSMMPMFIKKGEKGMGSNAIDNGARRKGTVDETSSVTTGKVSSEGRKWNFASLMPGTVMQDLSYGEEPTSFDTKRPNVNYAKFEETIINAVAWSCQIPPETLRLLYQSNFSASRQANIEFQIYLKDRFWQNGIEFYQPIYQAYTIQSVLLGDLKAPGFLDAWRQPKKWKEFDAWLNAEWTGLNRPSVDIKKDTDAMAKQLEYGFTTADQACRKLSGMSFKTVLSQRKREIDLMSKAGVSFSSEEDQNRNPITQPTPADSNDINNLKNMILNLGVRFEDVEDVVNGA